MEFVKVHAEFTLRSLLEVILLKNAKETIMKTTSKQNLFYPVMILSTLFLGLVSRSSHIPRETLFGTFGGDILWAALVYWGFALLFRNSLSKRSLKYSLIFSYGIELSQFNKEQWLMDLRATRLGALILGHDFLWSDMLCYTIGIATAFAIDSLLIRREHAFTKQQSHPETLVQGE